MEIGCWVRVESVGIQTRSVKDMGRRGEGFGGTVLAAASTAACPMGVVYAEVEMLVHTSPWRLPLLLSGSRCLAFHARSDVYIQTTGLCVCEWVPIGS